MHFNNNLECKLECRKNPSRVNSLNSLYVHQIPPEISRATQKRKISTNYVTDMPQREIFSENSGQRI